MSILALALLSSPAHALSCIWGVHSANLSDGDTVPSNIVVLLEHTMENLDGHDLVLTDGNGDAVPFTIDDGREYAFVKPDQPLQAGEYTLTSHDSQQDFGEFAATFTVEDVMDDEAPDKPTFVSAEKERQSGGEWGDTEGIAVEVRPTDGATHYEFEIATTGDFSDAQRVIRTQHSAFIGTGLCSVSAPGYSHSESYKLRVRAVDIAGNTSEWSEFDGPIPSAGCSSTNAPASLLLGGLATLALFGRRRRN